FFRDKCVFIGELPKTLMAQQQADAFYVPHSMLGGELMPGVEIGATAFLNLLRQDGLKLWNENQQACLIFVAGLILGAGLSLLRPWVAGAAAALGVIGLLVVAFQAAQHHVWFTWSIIAFAQIPVGLAWSIGAQFVSLRFRTEVAERALSETTK